MSHADSPSPAPVPRPSALAPTSPRLRLTSLHPTMDVPLPRWVPNDASHTCQSCASEFTCMKRRHHCRNCGGLVCAACSGQTARLVDHPLALPLRVCDGCVSAATAAGGSYVAARRDAAKHSSLALLAQTANMLSPKRLDASEHNSLCSPRRANGGCCAPLPASPRPLSTAPSFTDHALEQDHSSSDTHSHHDKEEDKEEEGGEREAWTLVRSLRDFSASLGEGVRGLVDLEDADERQTCILELLQVLDELEAKAKPQLLAAFIATQEEQLLNQSLQLTE